MDVQKYKILYKEGEAEISEKKSRFIAHIAPAQTEEEAQAFIEKIKKQYWDARHNCWAYSIGEKQPALRCSDDGEPSGTAGKPMLEVLTGQELHNVVAVVTRYFGGTLLGTGGLIRAYTKSTQEGIKESMVIEKCLGVMLSLTCDYTTSGKIQYLTATEHIPVLDTVYTDNVTFEMIVPGRKKMDVQKYKILYKEGEAEISEKKSRFIAHIAPAQTEEEAQAFIEKIKKQYWDARHNCWAYSIGEKQPALRCSDDGEPSGTAGKPMLEVLTGQELHNVVAVVTRYFGGTLLGTGGLIRAYTKSTQEGIKESMVIEKCLGVMLSLTCDYTTSGKIQYLTATEHIPVLDTVYTDNVTFEMIVPVEEVGSVEKKFMEASMGKAVLKKGEETYYAEIDGKISYDL